MPYKGFSYLAEIEEFSDFRQIAMTRSAVCGFAKNGESPQLPTG
jgi:hypothetical protein